MARTGRQLDAKPLGEERRPGQLTIDEQGQILLGLNRGDPFSDLILSVDSRNESDEPSAWTQPRQVRPYMR
jgi:hypothetical protein